jgi:hypothetical protein
MTKFRPLTLPLTLPEYRRVYELIYAVLEGRANTPRACMFFAIVGSLILNKHCQIAARPVAGAFMLCVDEMPSVIAIAKNTGGMITSDKDGFHMWVQTKTHVVDFMAPIFNEGVNADGIRAVIPRRMFQRPLSSEAESADALTRPGDFATLPNVELTNYFVDEFMNRPSHVDVLLAADRWFKKYPKKLGDLSLRDDSGQIHRLKLQAPEFSGAW